MYFYLNFLHSLFLIFESVFASNIFFFNHIYFRVQSLFKIYFFSFAISSSSLNFVWTCYIFIFVLFISLDLKDLYLLLISYGINRILFSFSTWDFAAINLCCFENLEEIFSNYSSFSFFSGFISGCIYFVANCSQFLGREICICKNFIFIMFILGNLLNLLFCFFLCDLFHCCHFKQLKHALRI